MAKARTSTHPVKKRTRESKVIIVRLQKICLALALRELLIDDKVRAE